MGAGGLATGLATELVAEGVDQYDAFCAWVLESCEGSSAVLDVGAGDGALDYPARIRRHVASISGVDPSPRIWDNALLDERHHESLEQHAASHEARYDIAIASYVVEHIAQPRSFLAALRRCLAPGGSAFLLTPHLFHYFGASAYAATRLGVDERLLRMLRDEKTLHEHHFPVQYRLNTRRSIRRAAISTGFSAVSFRLLDEPGIYQPYLPERLRWFPVVWSRAVHRANAAALAGTMIARLDA